jgi:hypothetical protein
MSRLREAASAHERKLMRCPATKKIDLPPIAGRRCRPCAGAQTSTWRCARGRGSFCSRKGKGRIMSTTAAAPGPVNKRSGHVSKCGGKLMRHALYDAANAHLRRSTKWSVLRAWGVKLTKRIGVRKACVAVARKLAIITHRMWVGEADFRFGQRPTASAG